MREFSVVSAEVLLKARAECILTPIGLLMGLDTVADCMNHPDIRPWFGHLLQDELMPQMPADGREEAVIQACRYLAFKPSSLKATDLADGLIDSWTLHILPLLNDRTPRLIQAFAVLVMLFTGIRREEDGYGLPQDAMQGRILTRDGKALAAFSRLSWDMQADSLSYAVLADAEIWGRDLRELDFLPDRLTEAITDIQILGLRQMLAGDDA